MLSISVIYQFVQLITDLARCLHANDSPFGLVGSVYSTHIDRAKRVASRMETGMVFINYPDISLPELPFGGVKRSGYGKELSSLGIEEFVNRKLIFAPNGHIGG
jgi:succinate-semialdehyde dehydrogenase/glutarate-semialdehyde dehydrogenase